MPRRVIIGFLQAGDLLGVSLKEQYLYTVEAITPIELRRFPRHGFEVERARQPHLREQPSRLCDEMTAAQDQMVLLSRKSSAERLAGFILLKARGQLDHDRLVSELPMTRLDMADYLGMTTETVSRTITELAGNGIIATSGRHSIVILRMSALIALAGGDPDNPEWHDARYANA